MGVRQLEGRASLEPRRNQCSRTGLVLLSMRVLGPPHAPTQGHCIPGGVPLRGSSVSYTLQDSEHGGTLRSRKTTLSVLPWSIERLSRSVSIFCGGSLIANSGFKLGSTVDANCDGVRALDMAKTLGRIYGSR